MNLTLKFKNINSVQGVPELKIAINNHVVWQGNVQAEINIEYPAVGQVALSITQINKDPQQHCIVEDGKIVADRNCELDEITIDGYNIEELKWLSSYLTDDGEILDKCLFFGKNGTWNISFEMPILRWILQTRHQQFNNDPNWEQDYESYQLACKLLNNLN